MACIGDRGGEYMRGQKVYEKDGASTKSEEK